jgi:hypothetical protein
VELLLKLGRQVEGFAERRRREAVELQWCEGNQRGLVL